MQDARRSGLGRTTVRNRLALILTLGLFGAAAVPAAAETQYYQGDMAFSSSSSRTEYGTRDADGGCVFTGASLFPESGADYLALGAEEVSFDPDTCQASFRVGPLSEGWGDDPPPSGATVDDEGWAEMPGLRTEPAPTTCLPRPWFPCELPSSPTTTRTTTTTMTTTWYPRKELYSSIAWEDPFQLDVNKTEVWLNYRATDDCAAAGRVRHRARNYWLSESGWRRTHSERDVDIYCTFVARVNRARFVNDVFCDIIGAPYPAPQTRTRMWPNRAVGLPRGRHLAVREYSKAGGCSGLLHAELEWKVRRL